MSHQIIELYVKAFILYAGLDGDWGAFEGIIKKYKHDTPRLMEDFRHKIPVFDDLLGRDPESDFIRTVHKHYIDARFGQLGGILTPGHECQILDKIFHTFTRYFYNETNVSSVLYIRIPVGTKPFFTDTEILDFGWRTCGIFGNSIANIRINI